MSVSGVNLTRIWRGDGSNHIPVNKYYSAFCFWLKFMFSIFTSQFVSAYVIIIHHRQTYIDLKSNISFIKTLIAARLDLHPLTSVYNKACFILVLILYHVLILLKILKCIVAFWPQFEMQNMDYLVKHYLDVNHSWIIFEMQRCQSINEWQKSMWISS